MVGRVYDFDAKYAELAEERDAPVTRVMLYAGREYEVTSAGLPAFLQMRMAALNSGDYDTLDPNIVETVVTALKALCPDLADEMETWDMPALQAFMAVFQDDDEDESPNVSTARAEVSPVRSES